MRFINVFFFQIVTFLQYYLPNFCHSKFKSTDIARNYVSLKIKCLFCNDEIPWLKHWFSLDCLHFTREYVSHMETSQMLVYVGLQILGLCFESTPLEQEGIFIVSHRLWHRPQFLRSQQNNCPIFVAFYDKQALLGIWRMTHLNRVGWGKSFAI